MAPIVCPNANLSEWKDLVKELGDDLAHLSFQRHIASGGTGIPTATEARDLLAPKEPPAGLSYSTVAPADRAARESWTDKDTAERLSPSSDTLVAWGLRYVSNMRKYGQSVPEVPDADFINGSWFGERDRRDRLSDTPVVGAAENPRSPRTPERPRGLTKPPTSSRSSGVPSPAPLPDPATLANLARDLYGRDKPLVAWSRDLQKGRNDGVYASEPLAKLAVVQWFATRSDASRDPAANFRDMLEYYVGETRPDQPRIEGHADTALDRDAFLSSIASYAARAADAALPRPDRPVMWDPALGRDVEVPEHAQAISTAFDDMFDEPVDPSTNAGLQEADEDRATKMVEYHPVTRLAALLADDKMMPGSRSWASVLEAVQNAMNRETPGSSNLDMSKLGEWMDAKGSKEPLVEFYRRFLGGLAGKRADGSRDLGPVYNFLAQFNGGYGNRATCMFGAKMEGGRATYDLREQHDNSPAVNLSKLPGAAAQHLSDPANAEALYQMLAGTGWKDRGKDRAPLFRRDEKKGLLKKWAVEFEDAQGNVRPEAVSQPVFDEKAFRLSNMRNKSEFMKKQAEQAEAAGNKTLADTLRRAGTVDNIDRSQRRRLVDLLEMVMGPQPALRNAIMHEMSIQSATTETQRTFTDEFGHVQTRTQSKDPFFNAVSEKGVKDMLWDLASDLEKSRTPEGGFAGLAPRVEATVRKYMLDAKIGTGGASSRTNFELLLGSLARKGTSKNPKQADGTGMAAAGFTGPLEERLRASAALKKHLEGLGYTANELRELDRTGRYRDGTPLVMVDGGTRGSNRGGLEEYQKTPGERAFKDFTDALEQAFTDPGRGVHPDYASFWTDQADSSKRLIYNLPRSMVPAGDYNAAWRFAENLANGSLKIPPKYRKQFADAQGAKPLQNVPGGLPPKIKLAVILGRVVDGKLDARYNKLLDGTLLQDEGLAAQERISFGLPDGKMNKTHVIDALTGKIFVKAATQHIVGGSVSPGNVLLDLHREIGKQLYSNPVAKAGYDSYELTDSGGAKFFDQQGTKDVVIGGVTYRLGLTEYDSSFKRRTTQLESPSRSHEIGVTAQNITDKISLRGGDKHYLSAASIATAGRALRIAAGLKLTPTEKAKLLKSPDSAALCAELARMGYDPQDLPLVSGEIAQQRIAADHADASVVVNGFDAVQRASGGAYDGKALLWHGEADPFLTDTYFYDQDGLHVPLVRVNDNDPTSRTGLWLRKGVTQEAFKDLVVRQVRAMREGSTDLGFRLKSELLKMVVDTKNPEIADHRVSFDDLVLPNGKFDDAAMYKVGGSSRPGAAAEDSPYVGGTIYHDVSRSPGTTMASHWPARRSEPVAWVTRKGFVPKATANERGAWGLTPGKEASLYWGAGEANESVVHPSLVRAAGTDNDGDKWRFSSLYKDAKTGVAHSLTAEAREKLADTYKAELAKEFRDAKKYGTDETKGQQAFDTARKAFAQKRFSHWKRVLGNELLREGLDVTAEEAKKRPGSLINTRMMPDITLAPFGKSGEEKVPHLAGEAIKNFEGGISNEKRAEIDSKLAAAGMEDLKTLSGKAGYVDVPYWLHVQIANGPGEEASAQAAAKRAAMNQESNRSREVTVASVRGLNQVIRLLDAQYDVPEKALLDEMGVSVFGALTRGKESVSEADRDHSNELVDDFMCSIVNMNIDAMKAIMPETAAAFMTSSWVSLEMPLLATQTFKSKQEVLDFHRNFMKFAQGKYGQAYFKTMQEVDSPVKESLFRASGRGMATSPRARLWSRMLEIGDKDSANGFMKLYDISQALRNSDLVANAHKRNLGHLDSLASLARARDSFDLMRGAREPRTVNERGDMEPVHIRLARKDTTEAVARRAEQLYSDADAHFSSSPLSRRPGTFGSVFAEASKGSRRDPAETESFVNANLHALSALSLLNDSLRQRIGTDPKSLDVALRLAEAAVHKAYGEQLGNRLLQDMQTSDGKVIRRMSGRDLSEALAGSGMEPLWAAAKELKGVTLKAGDKNYPADWKKETVLSSDDIQHLMYFYAVTVHGANMRGRNGNFLRMLSPEVHARVGERVSNFVREDPNGFATPGAEGLAGVLAQQLAADGGAVLDPNYGTKVSRVPLGYVDHFVGLVSKPKALPEGRAAAASRMPDGTYRFDGPELNRRFDAKAWTQPRLLKDGSKASPMPADALPTREQFAQFVALHEYAHGLPAFKKMMQDAREKKRTIGSVEDQVNAYAMQFTRKMSDMLAKDPKFQDALLRVQDAMKSEAPKTIPGLQSDVEVKPRILSPAVADEGRVSTGSDHAIAYRKLYPDASDAQIEKVRASDKAGFLVEEGEEQRVVGRKEAMEIAKKNGQLKEGFDSETNLHSHMLQNADEPNYAPRGPADDLSYSTVHQYLGDDTKFERYEMAGNMPSKFTWLNARRTWYQRGHDWNSQMTDVAKDEMDHRMGVYDRRIWAPILSAQDYETAVRALNEVQMWPPNEKDAARMRDDIRKLMDYNPEKRWVDHRAEQARMNPEGPQGRYDDLMKRFAALPTAEQNKFIEEYNGVSVSKIQDGLYRSLVLGENAMDGTREQAFRDALAAATSPKLVQGELGIHYSTLPAPDVVGAELARAMYEHDLSLDHLREYDETGKNWLAEYRARIPESMQRRIDVVYSPGRLPVSMDEYASIKSSLAARSIVDPSAVRWATVNAGRVNIGQAANEEALRKIVSDHTRNRIEKLDPVVRGLDEENQSRWGGWKDALSKYDPYFQALMLDYPAKLVVDDRRRDKGIPGVSLVALQAAYDYAAQHPSDLGIVKAYQRIVTQQATEAKDTTLSASGKARWIHIPRARIGAEQHLANVELLRRLSPDTWCTHTWNAPNSVANTDNWILVADGKTVAGMEIYPDRNFVKEVTSVHNNGIASIEWLDDTIAKLRDLGVKDMDMSRSVEQAKKRKASGETKDFAEEFDRGEDENDADVQLLRSQRAALAANDGALAREDPVTAASHLLAAAGSAAQTGEPGLTPLELRLVRELASSDNPVARSLIADTEYSMAAADGRAYHHIDRMRSDPFPEVREVAVLREPREELAWAMTDESPVVRATYAKRSLRDADYIAAPGLDFEAAELVRLAARQEALAWTRVDPAAEVRAEAAEYWEGPRGEPSVPQWVIDDPAVRVRLASMKNMNTHMVDIHPHILDWAAHDASPEVRAHAAWVLGDAIYRVGPKGPGNIEWARIDPAEYVRQSALLADIRASRDLSWARNDPSAEIRRRFNEVDARDHDFNRAAENPTVLGYYDTRTDRTVLNAAAHELPEDIVMSSMHEIAHRGMWAYAREKGGLEDLESLLSIHEKNLMDTLPVALSRSGHKTLEDFAKDYGFDLGTRNGKFRLLQELAARHAETSQQEKTNPGWWQRFLSAARALLSKWLRAPVSEDATLNAVRRFVNYGETAEEGGGYQNQQMVEKWRAQVDAKSNGSGRDMSYSTVAPDPAVVDALNDPKVSEEMPDVESSDPVVVAKFSGTFSVSPDAQQKEADRQVKLDAPHAAASAPLAAQEDAPPSRVPAGIREQMPLTGKAEQAVAGMEGQNFPNWKAETLIDPNLYLASLLDHRMQLEGPRALFHQHEMWSAWADAGKTAARYTNKNITDLLALADKEGRVSDMINMERPDVNIEALARPGEDLVKKGTTTGQARGRMGGYAPQKGAGQKVGQKAQLSDEDRRLGYWVNHTLSSWAAGEVHQLTPSSITIPGNRVTPEQATEAIKKAQAGKNPLPNAIADAIIGELQAGNVRTILPSEANGLTSIAVPVDVVEKVFMDSDYRKTLIAHGRRDADLTKDGLVKIARDHFDREFERISRDMPFLLDDEDGFAGYLSKLRNYVPMKHGTGPMAHAVDKIERDLQQTLSKFLDEAAAKQVEKYNDLMSPEKAMVDLGKMGFPELAGEKVPKKLTETPEWPMERLYDLWSKERKDLAPFRGRADFIAKVKDGTFDRLGLLPVSAQYADVIRELHNATMRLLMRRKIGAEQLKQPDDGFDPVALARALKTQLKKLPGEEPTFARDRAFQTHQQAWETAGLLPSSETFTDLVADYGTRQMVALSRKITLNNLLMASDIDGRPLVMALPNLEFADQSGVITDQTWEHVARKWAEYFQTPYDEAKSGKENAHRIVSANVTGQSSDRFVDKFKRRFNYTTVPTAYSSVSQWYGQQDRPDDVNVMDMMVGGESAAVLQQLMQTHDLWESNRIMSGLQDVNQFMKINALQLSFFHAKALLEDIESATWGKALLPASIRAKDPSHISLGEWFRMLRTNDPYVKELTRIMDQVGITQSYGSVNPADVSLGKTEKNIDTMGDWLGKNFNARAGKDFKAIAEAMTGEQATFIFEELNNIAKLMVTHSLLQKSRVEAYKSGRPFDPVKAMEPYNRYVNEAVGGLNPAHYSWATPHVRQASNLFLFSWQWSLGAWNAAGGQLLTGKVFESKLTPEAAQFTFKRRLPAMIAMVLIAEPAVAQLGTYLAAAAAGKTTDDDHPWMWDNEAGKQTYADITPMAKLMPWWKGDAASKNKNRRLYVRWGKQVHEIMSWLEDPMKTAGGKSSLALQTAWGLATGRSMGTDWNLGFKNEGLTGWVNGRHGFEDSRIAYAGKNLVPGLGSFSVSQMIRNPDAGLLGMFGPTSRGTSYHAACQRAMAVLSAWSETDSYRSFQYNQKTQTNLHGLLADILDDARANGEDPESVLNASRKAIIKVKYGEMYDALSGGKMDQERIERVAREILRLNGAVEGVRSSVRNRNALYGAPAELTKEQSMALEEAFHEPAAKARREDAKAARPKKPKPADQFAALREYADAAKKKDS